MLRRFAALCLLVTCLTACGSDPTDRAAGQEPGAQNYWLTEPATDSDRLELLRRARGIDPCALLPRDALAEFGTVLRVFNHGPSRCTATLNSDDLSGRTQFRLLVSAREPGVPAHGAGTQVRTVDGVAVTTSRDLDQLGEDYRDQ
ncbi:hypothetical protein [Nocardia carnea]|uniref:DUF3558 domain-containing protein n=1 Tax=Nocardia carnea TaxID=37328 RepID=A0ABW7TDZ5_9NOCA|nr:hypothetical protein [Nocardia carnea]